MCSTRPFGRASEAHHSRRNAFERWIRQQLGGGHRRAAAGEPRRSSLHVCACFRELRRKSNLVFSPRKANSRPMSPPSTASGTSSCATRARSLSFSAARRPCCSGPSGILSTAHGGWRSRRAPSAMGASRLLTGELGNLTINAGNLSDLSEWIRRRRWVTWLDQARAAVSSPRRELAGRTIQFFRTVDPRPAASALERVSWANALPMSFVRSP